MFMVLDHLTIIMNKLVTAIRSCGISFEVGLYIIIINSDNFHAMHRSGTS